MRIDKYNIDIDFILKRDFIIACLFDSDKTYTLSDIKKINYYIDKLFNILSKL